MKVIFNNGREVNINQQVAELIKDKILNGDGAKQWQIFSNEKGEVFLMVNLSEVSCIIKSD